MKIIEVKIKTNYGRKSIYPLNYQKELFTLTGQKTLTEKNIEALKNLGFQFIVKQEKI